MANTLLYALTRAASHVLALREHEEEVEAMNRGRLPNLPMVGNTDTQGGIKMGSLTKIAEENAAKLAESQVGKPTDGERSGAENIKIACAHLTNYLAAASAEGRQIKTASVEGTINKDKLVKCASLYVIDEYDLYKEAMIDKTKVLNALKTFWAKTKTPLASNVRGAGGKMAGPGYLKALGKWGKGAGEAVASTAKDLAAKKGVQAAAGAAGAGAAGYGISELLREKGIIGQ